MVIMEKIEKRKIKKETRVIIEIRRKTNYL